MYNPVEKFINFPKMERKQLEFWKENDCFNKLRKQNEGKPKWSFLDGPITANNPMGVHHAWGRTLKDLYLRYHAMTGHELRYQNGFDCQGLWVEVEVEKELGIKSKTDIETLGIEKFVQACKDRVQRFSKVQTDQSVRLGYWMDWDNSYFTMSEVNNYLIWQFLKKCHQRNLIYKGNDVMPWCIECGSAMSQHEIATEGYRERTHHSLFVFAKLVSEPDAFLAIWTTTPWTLPANIAAAVHPEETYVKVAYEGRKIYIMKARLSVFGKEKPEILEEMPGKKLEGLKYVGLFDEIPAQNGVEHKVILWTEVSSVDGTGIVHIAPGCGQEDFSLSGPNKLSIIAPLDEFGNYLADMGWLAGKNVRKVDDEVFDSLKKKGFFWKRDKIVHRYPVCWRHGTDLVFRLVDEWFISMDGLREDIMAITRKIRWIPEWGMDRELDWLKNMHDWMISKKRYWGLALPIYVCEKCGEFDVIGGREELKERAVEGWDQLEGRSPHRPYVDMVKIACPKCGGKASRIKDVGNPWLDAGIVPYSTMGYSEDKKYWEQWFPADFITECFPGQFRNWFYSLLAMSAIMENKEPFKVLLGHALVKDEKGNDMHKSAGNSIAFDEAADKIGAEVMRYIFVSQNPLYNLNFGYNMAKEYQRKLLTLWNVYSFYMTYAEIDGFNPFTAKKIPHSKRNSLDRWIVSKMQVLIDESREDLDDYAAHLMMEKFERFVDNLSNWYLRRSRKRFWGSEMTDDKLAAFHTLYEALACICRLMAPVIPFLTEEIYQNITRAVDPSAPISVHLCSYPEADDELVDEPLEFRIDTVVKFTSLGRAARAKVNLKVRQPLKEIVVKPLPSENDEEREVLMTHKDELLEELNIKDLRFTDKMDGFAAPVAKLSMPLIAPKFGPQTGAVVAEFNKLTSKFVEEQLESMGTLLVTVDGQKLQIDKAEVMMAFDSVKPWSSVVEKGVMVAVDTTVSKELELEGIARDFVRHVQNTRKDAGFDVSDRIDLRYETTEAVVKEALVFWKEFICAETLAVSFAEGGTEEGAFHKTVEFHEYEVKVGLTRKKAN